MLSIPLCFIYFYTCDDESVTFNSIQCHCVDFVSVLTFLFCYQVIQIGHGGINFYLFVEENQFLFFPLCIKVTSDWEMYGEKDFCNLCMLSCM